MNVDEMALAVACAVGVDNRCGSCEDYVIDRLVQAFPGFRVEDTSEGDRHVVELSTGERRVVAPTAPDQGWANSVAATLIRHA